MHICIYVYIYIHTYILFSFYRDNEEHTLSNNSAVYLTPRQSTIGKERAPTAASKSGHCNCKYACPKYQPYVCSESKTLKYIEFRACQVSLSLRLCGQRAALIVKATRAGNL